MTYNNIQFSSEFDFNLNQFWIWTLLLPPHHKFDGKKKLEWTTKSHLIIVIFIYLCIILFYAINLYIVSLLVDSCFVLNNFKVVLY